LFKALSQYLKLPVDSFGPLPKKETMTEFGRFLHFYQAQKKISLRQFYKEIGVNKDTYRMMLTYKFKPSKYNLEKLMKYFDKPLIFFMDLYTGKVKLEDIKHKFL
jgi:hypothetical protein